MRFDFALGRVALVALLLAITFSTLAVAETPANAVDPIVGGVVGVDAARQVATFECLSRYGDYPEFTHVTYLDGNGDPAVYVFVYAKSDRFSSEADLERHLAAATDEYYAAKQAHRDLRAAKADLSLASDFVTIYVSATTTRAAVPEARTGLPEYFANYGRLTHDLAAKGISVNQRKFYYFGAGLTYFQPTNGSAAVSVTSIDKSIDVTAASYRVASPSSHVAAQWDYFINTVGANDVRGFVTPRRDGTDVHLGDETRVDTDNLPVPEFDESDYSASIFPNGGADPILAHASALGWYDSRRAGKTPGDFNYFNLVDLATANDALGNINSFSCAPGFFNDGNAAHPSDRVEQFLYDLATDMGYNFGLGTSPADPTTGVLEYTNADKGLEFAISYNAYGVSFAKIAADIDAGNPVVMAVDEAAFGGDDGSGGHGQYADGARVVCVTGYDPVHTEAIPQPIYVTAGDANGEVVWDFSDLTGVKTWEYTPGGSAGDYFDAPEAHTAATKYSQTFDISWGQVSVAGPILPTSYTLFTSTNAFATSGNSASHTSIAAPVLLATDGSHSVTYVDNDVVSWSVVAYNSLGNACGFSTVTTATVDVQTYAKPDNASFLPDGSVTKKTLQVPFTWDAQKVTEGAPYGVDVYATSYRFMLDTVNTYDSPVLIDVSFNADDESVTDVAHVLTKTITLPDSSDNWYWKVSAKNELGGASTFSDNVTFAAYSPTFSAPTLSSPSDAWNSYSKSMTFQFAATRVAGEGGVGWIYPTKYKLQYSEDDPTFLTGVTSVDVTDGGAHGTLSRTVNDLAAGRYYWHVAAYKEDGTTVCPYSLYRNFKALDPVFSAPDNASFIPTDGFEKKTLFVTLSWAVQFVTDINTGAVTNATKYILKYDKVNTFDGPDLVTVNLIPGETEDLEIEAGRVSYPIELASASDNWYWKLAVENDAHEQSPFSTPISFKAFTPTFSAVSVVSPEDALTTTSTADMTFEWLPQYIAGEVGGAARIYSTEYSLEYSTSPTFDVGPATTTIDVPDVVLDGDTVSYDVSGLAVADYYWHVAAKKENDALSAYSTARTLTVANTDLRVAITVTKLAGCQPSTSDSVRAIWSNHGPEDAFDSRVSIWWRNDSTDTGHDVLLTHQDFDTLLASGADTAWFVVTVPSNIAGRTYGCFVAKVDDESKVHDGTLTNNVAFQRVLTVAPDLSVSSSSATPATVAPGARTNFKAAVLNGGTGDCAATQAKIYWSTDNILNVPGDALLATVTVAATKATKTTNISSSVALPDPITGNSGYLIIKVDAASEAIETNEGNNTRALAVTVSRANLGFASATLARKDGATYYTVRQMNPLQYDLKVNGIISNTGTLASASMKIKYYLSDDNVWDGDDVLQGALTQTVAAIPVGKTAKLTEVSLAKELFPDLERVFIILKADADAEVTETNETDNIWVFGLDINTGPTIHNEGLTGDVPTIYSLSDGFPNPFNSTTLLRFGLPEAANVHLGVYDISGRELAVLANNQMEAGYHQIAWTPVELAAGVYFVKMNAGGFTSVKKLSFVK